MLEHRVRLIGLALKIRDHARLSLGSHDINHDIALLTEPPAATDRLIPLLKRVGRKERLMRAMLLVQTKAGDLRLGD